jgi:hypothetical protein
VFETGLHVVARQAVSDAVRMGDPALIAQRTKALEYLLRYYSTLAGPFLSRPIVVIMIWLL